jgi:hypothetical protein
MSAKQQPKRAVAAAEHADAPQLVMTVQQCEGLSPRKQELLDHVNLLSDYECEHLLRAVKNVATGERFWEGDVGICGRLILLPYSVNGIWQLSCLHPVLVGLLSDPSS